MYNFFAIIFISKTNAIHPNGSSDSSKEILAGIKICIINLGTYIFCDESLDHPRILGHFFGSWENLFHLNRCVCEINEIALIKDTDFTEIGFTLMKVTRILWSWPWIWRGATLLYKGVWGISEVVAHCTYWSPCFFILFLHYFDDSTRLSSICEHDFNSNLPKD